MRSVVSVSLALLLGVWFGLSGCGGKHSTRKQPPADVAAARAVAPQNSAPADADKTASGLASKVLKPGSGDRRPTREDKVRVSFTAWNSHGEQTDSSQQRGGPEVFEVSGVIAGWAEALQLMRVGERRRLWIPNDLVYPGRPGYPRPAAVFDLELLEIIADAPRLPAPADVAAVPADADKTSSGLAYKLLSDAPEQQKQQKPHAWDHVTVRYAGWTQTGEMVSRSTDRPARFALDDVMPGWREALQLLSVGDKARLWIPESLAFHGRVGEPRGPLVYDMELVSIERQPRPPRAPAMVSAAPRDAKRTKSGLAYRMLKKGAGATMPTADDRVTVHYSAWTSDGKLFDSSVKRGRPITLPVDRVIPGWAEGLQLMAEGDKALFWIPEALAYAGGEGGPKGMLVYEVELLQVATVQPDRSKVH